MASLEAQTSRSREKVYTRSQIEGLIADGRKIIIFDGQVIKADAWLSFHPGGPKAILHMVGRDGTVEIRAFHSRDAQQYMQKFVIGKVVGRWTDLIPPIQGGHFTSFPADQAEDLDSRPSLEDSFSSSSSTAPPSPIFDHCGTNETALRMGLQTDTASISSVSSLSTSEDPLVKEQSPSLDSATQDKILADLAKYPPLDAYSQAIIVQKYRALDDRMRGEGLYECPYSAYAIEVIRYIFLFSVCMVFLHYGRYALSGLFLGVLWQQLVFTAHDAGHMGITHNFQIDTCIGIFIADFLGGLSLGWWKRNHNVHHIVTNSPEHDPDIEHMPLFAISHRFFESLKSTYYDRVMSFDAAARFAVKYQKYLYYPILTLGRFNLYRLSWEFLLLGLGPRKGPARWHRWLEITGQLCFWTWFGYGVVYLSIPAAWDRFVFVMVSHMVTGVLHVQITLSHFAMSTADLGVHESFPQKMLRTTMDVHCPPWLDFFHGGLQFQAIHHLYPRMPRHNLRRAQKLVEEFCDEVEIPYAIYGFVDGNKEVLGRLSEVAKQARMLGECRRVCAQRGVFDDTH